MAMFNLEQSITDWRKQMLDAGIKSPVPLEELEGHLREDIEKQRKLGLEDQQAFASAVQKIGDSGALKTEFKKNGATITKELVINWSVVGTCLISAYGGFRVIFWSISALQMPPVQEYRVISIAVLLLGLLMVIFASYGAFICIKQIKTSPALLVK